METVYVIIAAYVVSELFEIQWQKAPTMLEMLVRLYRRYRTSIFLFLLLHPTYFFAIWLILHTHLGLPSILLLFAKTADIATKLVLIQQVFEKKEISAPLHEMLVMPLEKWMPYAVLAIYVPLFVWALY